jgi:hypothetical protein
MTHSNDPEVKSPYYCTNCERRFTRPSTARQHIKTALLRDPHSDCGRKGDVGGLSEHQAGVSENQKDIGMF